MDGFKIGDRVRCNDTDIIGTITAMKTGEELGFPVGSPIAVFIETDAKAKKGIVREIGCLEHLS